MPRPSCPGYDRHSIHTHAGNPDTVKETKKRKKSKKREEKRKKGKGKKRKKEKRKNKRKKEKGKREKNKKEKKEEGKKKREKGKKKKGNKDPSKIIRIERKDQVYPVPTEAGLFKATIRETRVYASHSDELMF